MAIEAPLDELGIHDVFQLVELSRKSGILRVTSAASGAEGFVVFAAGRIAHAGLRGAPSSAEELLLASGRVSMLDLEYANRLALQGGTKHTALDVLIDAGAISAREVERRMREHIESVVFELMSWQEGFSSFEEQALAELPADIGVQLHAESLMMEGARRADEWTRIADKVPDLSAVPVLSPGAADDETQLDLPPDAWAVLALVDGERDVHAIAGALDRTAFDVAKVVYVLVLVGIVEVIAAGTKHV